jgi:hypothetical protein
MLSETKAQCEQLGVQYPQEIVCFFLFKALPPDYSTTIEIIKGQRGELNWKDVCAKIREKEDSLLRKKGGERNRDKNSNALFSSTNPGQGGPSNKFCAYCKKKGHIIGDCRKKIAKDKKKLETNTSEDSKASSEASNLVLDAANVNLTPKILALHSMAFPEESEISEISEISDVPEIPEIPEEPNLVTLSPRILALGSSNTPIAPDVWFIDSGATQHMCCNSEFLTNLVEIPTRAIAVGGRFRVKCTIKGSINFNLKSPIGFCLLTLSDVLYVPGLGTNLISVGQMTNKGAKVSFLPDKTCEVHKSEGELTFVANQEGNLYELPVASHEIAAITLNSNNSLDLWHRRFNHLNQKSL